MSRVICCILFFGLAAAHGAEPIPRCQVIPLTGHRVSFQVDGIEKITWHFGKQYERPFLFPLVGPSGASLTRMGHPGASNHDHHRSIWFAHHEVDGNNFWGNTSTARIRQKNWYVLADSNEKATFAARLGWYNGKEQEVMDTDVVVSLCPLHAGEFTLELQLICRVPEGRESVYLGKTNFGFLAVRVAKSISTYFGDGVIRNSEGQLGEKQIFGKPARWIDYSGSVPVGTGARRTATKEGITYFDHPANPRHPAHWHVREDGWMGASFCMHEGFAVSKRVPLTLRYLLHVHAGDYDPGQAATLAKAFFASNHFVIRKSTKPHQQYEVGREAS